MRVVVEFLGVPRRRTGVESLELTWGQERDLEELSAVGNDAAPRVLNDHAEGEDCEVCVGDVLAEVAKRYPELEREFFETSSEGVIRIGPHLILSINGGRLTRDSSEGLADGDRLLLLTADVGG